MRRELAVVIMTDIRVMAGKLHIAVFRPPLVFQTRFQYKIGIEIIK